MNKIWWSNFNKREASYIIFFLWNKDKGGNAWNYPPDCSACGICGCPVSGLGPCEDCKDEFEKLIKSKKLGFLTISKGGSYEMGN